MMPDEYIIRGGVAGHERLRVLSRAMAPSTKNFLARLEIGQAARCLDAGCGGGDVTVELARMAGPAGRALGIDTDGPILDIARKEALIAGATNVEYVQVRLQDFRCSAAFDLAYARFLLSHVPAPAAAVNTLVDATTEGGIVAVEDVEVAAGFSHPPSPAYTAFCDLYIRAGQAVGGDPNIGPRLAEMLFEAGLTDVGVQVAQPVGFDRDIKRLSPLTLEAIADSVVALELTTRDRVDSLIGELYAFAAQPAALLSLPRVFQAWGRVPAKRRRRAGRTIARTAPAGARPGTRHPPSEVASGAETPATNGLAKTPPARGWSLATPALIVGRRGDTPDLLEIGAHPMTTNTARALSTDLGRHLRGRLVTAADPEWDRARTPWNRRVDQRPVAVVEAAGADDLAAIVAYAGARGLRVAVQSTGHGASVGLEDTILVRTHSLRDITIDRPRARAVVGPGVALRDLLNAVDPVGLVFSPGSAADVGVVGYVLFGGVGLLGRQFGFAANHVLGAEVVTADGSWARADATTNPELFWALRGGGGGFALVVRLELALQAIPELFGGQLLWPAERALEVFHAYRDWTVGLPESVTSIAAMVRLPPLAQLPEALRGRHLVGVTICHTGDAHEAAGLLAPLRALGPPLVDNCRPLRPAGLATLHGVPTVPLPARIPSTLLGSLPPATIGRLVDQVTPADAPLIAVELRHLGGAYARPRPDHGATGAIAAPYLLELVGLAPTPEADHQVGAYHQQVSDALAEWTAGTTLANFADPAAECHRVFDAATRDRLAAAKRRYDPADVLHTSFADRQQIRN